MPIINLFIWSNTPATAAAGMTTRLVSNYTPAVSVLLREIS